MNWQQPFRSLRYRLQGGIAREAGASLFQGLRVRLTLWYCGVFFVALVLFGVVLYFGTQYFLLTPVENDTAAHAQVHQSEWANGSINSACPLSNESGLFGPPGRGFQMPEIVVCFDGQGNLIQGQNTAGLPPAFLTNTLVEKVLQTGQPAGDIVNGGNGSGAIYRYALIVPNAAGSGTNGVLLVGESIQSEESALALLLDLLLALGVVALLGAGVGGLFLANRALAPARLAWSNQQRFIADAAHELRTPLTLLRADAEVLLRGRERMEEEDATLLEDIVAETHHMGRLATNLLTLARLDSGTIRREFEVVNLAKMAEEAVQRVQSFAAQNDIIVTFENTTTTDRLYVIGDPALLEQTVLGLLDNAIKYNRRGGQVNVQTAARDEQAELEVRDTGPGIAAEHLPHMGERFYRVDKARSREAGGTGLGLSIARNTATAHGGSLQLASVFGQGTTVTLTLPLAHETAHNQSNETAETSETESVDELSLIQQEGE